MVSAISAGVKTYIRVILSVQWNGYHYERQPFLIKWNR